MVSTNNNTLPIDRKSRVHLPYYGQELRDPSERIQDFEECAMPFTVEAAMKEASRCLHCPEPAPCMLACPLHNNIPDALWLVEQGDILGAAKIYHKTSSMPEICGRVCPHEQLCQGACVLSRKAGPVLTGCLEVFIADHERMMNATAWPEDIKPSGKSVAIVGAGPSGLACAQRLALSGHKVTIYDNKPAPGGLLVYGIPNFKLSKKVVFRKLDDFQELGVKFVLNTMVGKDVTVDSLLEQGFDAVYLAVGANTDATMGIPGEDLPGVFQGTEFLIRSNTPEHLLPAGMDPEPVTGKKIVVVGGGDTASDCLRASLRLGASEVLCIYRRTEKEMPGSVKDREYARQEGAEYQFLTQPVQFIPDENGHLKAIECLRMELGEPDEKGRRRPVPIEGSNFIVETEIAVLAIGYWPDPLIGQTTPDLETDKYGLIKTNRELGTTSRPGVFAGGDAVTGPDLVVTATAAGHRAADSINHYLASLEN